MSYDLELKRAVEEIKRIDAETVCMQMPEGLKPKATEMADFLQKNTDAKIFIWADTCFGACDVPDLKDVDLLIQWGHSKWKSM